MLARAALAVSLVALLFSMSGWATAATKKKVGKVSKVPALVNGKIPAKYLPAKVAAARTADRVGGRTAVDLTLTCPEATVDLGTWCLQSSTYSPTNDEVGRNDYLFATQKCVELGGWLPTAAQLVGAADRVRLASTLTDNATTSAPDEDAGDGLRDRREMSSTLVTTAAGASAAGSQGVSEGSRGDPRAGEPDPVPAPANPRPDTLQYVTVYDNGNQGGFAGAQPVTAAQSFRCAFAKKQGANPEDLG